MDLENIDSCNFYNNAILADVQFDEKKNKFGMEHIFQTKCFKYGYIPCEKSALISLLEAQKRGIKDVLNGKCWFMGNGLYVYESYTYAYALSKSNSYKEAAVLGIALNLGKCLDLLEYSNIKLLEHEYSLLKKKPKLKSGQSKQMIDYAVIEYVARKNSYDSVRGILCSGKEIYTSSSIREEEQVLISIRNTKCILSYFNATR